MVQANGARLLGGHSLRVTGAQRLAALGVDVIKITVLARWSGDAVLRYVREAPLGNLSAEVRALEEQRSLMAAVLDLQASVARLGNRVDQQHLEQELAVKDLFAKYGLAREKPFFAKAGKGAFKVHRAMSDGADLLPQLWRTRCGVRFGLWTFTRHASVAASPADSLCERCFGREAAAPAFADAGSSGSAGSAGASSGSGEWRRRRGVGQQ